MLEPWVFDDVDGIRAIKSDYTSDHLPFILFPGRPTLALPTPGIRRIGCEPQPNRLYILAATSAGHAYAPALTLSNLTIFDLLQAAGISWKVDVTDLSRAAKPV